MADEKAGPNLFAGMLQDARFAFRLMRNHPAFTAAAVLSLALGIGANAAIFSIIEAALLRPLPYPHSDRLLVVKEESRLFQGYATFATYAAWRERSRSFDQLAAFSPGSGILSGDSEAPERIDTALVSAEFFPLLGARPFLGRLFTAAEDRPGNNSFAVLSYRLWQRRYHGAPDIVGRTILLNRNSCTVLGVLPHDFRFLPVGEAGLWRPVSVEQPKPAQASGRYYLRIIGRRKPDVLFEAAAAEMDAIARGTQRTPMGASLAPLQEEITGGSRRLLLLLGGAVGLILLIACVNVANLQMARGSVRATEFAIRTALGSSRFRMIRQLIVESAMLSLAGGVLGLGLACAGTSLAAVIPAVDLPRAGEIRVDLWVVLFTVSLSILTSFLFGLAPARQAWKTRLQPALKEGGRISGPDPRHKRFSSTLVAVEIGLALALLAGAGLMIQTLRRLSSVDPGFRTDRVLTMTVSLQQDRQRIETTYRELLERIRALPGVRAPGLVNTLPMGGSETFQGMLVEGIQERQILQLRIVTPGYLEAIGLPLLRGRNIDAHDGVAVALVNETFERRYFPGGAVGRRISMGKGENDWIRIVGLVGDIRHKSLTSHPLAEVYVSAFSRLWSRMRLAVYTQGDPSGLIAGIRTILADLDPDAALSDLATMEERRVRTMGTPRLLTLLLGLFAAAALALSVLGAYSVVNYAVSRRTHEIGLRMALGATRPNVVVMVIRESLPALAAGILAGLGLAAASTRLLKAFLFEIEPLDPASLSAAAAAILLSGLLAAYVPARRASSIDPAIALDYE